MPLLIPPSLLQTKLQTFLFHSENCGYFVIEAFHKSWYPPSPPGNGVISDTVTYDSNGNLIKNIHERDWEGDGITDSASTTTWTYDANGRLVERIVEDGSTRNVIIFTYDGLGRISAIDSDGSIATFIYTDNSRRFTSMIRSGLPSNLAARENYSYSLSEHQATVTRDFYDHPYSTPHRQTTYTFLYDSEGREIENTETSDYPWYTKTNRSYNEQGWRIESDTEGDYDGDGIIEFHRVGNTSYDWNNLTFTYESESYSDDDIVRRDTGYGTVQQICSDNLANPYDPEQLGIGDYFHLYDFFSVSW